MIAVAAIGSLFVALAAVYVFCFSVYWAIKEK